MSWRDRPYSGVGFGGGGGGPRFSDNPMAWAPSLGTVFGIRVQVHILFLIFVAIELLRAATGGFFWWEFRYLGILFSLVFLHELGHCFGARRVGGSADRVLMWPLGGLAYVAPPHRPGANLFTAMAGPLVNVGFCVLSALVLIAATGSLLAVPWNPFHARIPDEVRFLFARHEPLGWVYQFFYINYLLVLFNVCLPVFPLDGGRIVQSALWYRLGYRRSMLVASTVGMVGAVILGCFGLFNQNFLLIGIAVFGYITCMQERRMVAMAAEYGAPEYNVSAAYDPPPEHPRRRGSWREGAWARKQKKRAEEQVAVDRILAKVHEQGMASLTRQEKKALARATKRQQAEESRLGRTDRL